MTRTLLKTTNIKRRSRNDPKWVAARFDRIAGSYPLFEKLFFVPSIARGIAVERMRVEKNDRVLIVGCGQGKELEELSRRVGPNGQVIGIDLSARMLSGAQAIARAHDLTNVELTEMDIHCFRTEEPMDAVYFPFSLTCLGDPEGAIRHAIGMLNSGGRLVVLDAQLPPGLSRITGPLMPMIRSFLESTVLGDPDMRPIELLEQFGTINLDWLRKRTYFVASMVKTT